MLSRKHILDINSFCSCDKSAHDILLDGKIHPV